jgi:two-component system, OmpR family, sensor kinase
MPPSTSLVRRVAWGAALSASAAALLAALVTVALAAYLVQRAEDRRLNEAAITLAVELDNDLQKKTVAEIVQDEAEELEHTGILFAVFDTDGHLLAGDQRLELLRSDGCTNARIDTLRMCSARSSGHLIAVVASTHITPLPLLITAAISAVALAAALTWAASRPLSRFIIAPLSRLRAQIAALDVDALSRAHLGENEHISEVDALRDTMGQLIQRVEQALEQAHRFAVNAAHELRTPLTSVRAELELLSENVTDSTMRADVLRAQHKLAELVVLVERLLILALPKRSPTDAYDVVSMRDLFEDTVAGLPAADRPRVLTPQDDALVQGDAVLLSTMVANALSNALKFSATVSVAFQVHDRHVVIWIDDSGPGVDVAERERVFEPFFRSPEALRRRMPGHGLGLALIRHIARTHNGDARFVDKTTSGARLEIRILAHKNREGHGLSSAPLDPPYPSS